MSIETLQYDPNKNVGAHKLDLGEGTPSLLLTKATQKGSAPREGVLKCLVEFSPSAKYPLDHSLIFTSMMQSLN